VLKKYSFIEINLLNKEYFKYKHNKLDNSQIFFSSK